MAGNTNFPTALDDDSSLYDVTDSVNTVQAAHHNNLKEALKAIESKVGIFNSSVSTSLDYRIGNPTGSHSHDGASGQGQTLNPTGIVAPSGGPGAPVTLHDHLMDYDRHPGGFHFMRTFRPGSAIATINYFLPFEPFGWGSPSEPDYLRLTAVSVQLRRPPSGATTIIDVNFGPTSIWQGITAQRLMIPPGATYDYVATFAIATYEVGNIITADFDQVGSQAPGEDFTLNFSFRE